MPHNGRQLSAHEFARIATRLGAERAEWLRTKTERNKEILKALADGEKVTHVARRFELSLAMVQKIRDRGW